MSRSLAAAGRWGRVIRLPIGTVPGGGIGQFHPWMMGMFGAAWAMGASGK